MLLVVEDGDGSGCGLHVGVVRLVQVLHVVQGVVLVAQMTALVGRRARLVHEDAAGRAKGGGRSVQDHGRRDRVVVHRLQVDFVAGERRHATALLILQVLHLQSVLVPENTTDKETAGHSFIFSFANSNFS
jgi:hypothetical protein